MVKCVQLHSTDFAAVQLIRHKLMKANFPKSNQKYSTKGQKIGTKRQPDIWNWVVPINSTILSPDRCRQGQILPIEFLFFDQSSSL